MLFLNVIVYVKMFEEVMYGVTETIALGHFEVIKK